MTDIPKKLGNPPTPPETEFEMGMIILVNKINEIIDYLQAKEEASKGECKHSWDTSGGICQLCGITYRESREELRPNPPDAWGITVPVNLPEHSGDIAWCECECHTKGTPQPKCDKCYPPGHEDWEEWTEDEKRYGFKIKNHFNKGEMDYIRDNFVSKEKIKRVLLESTYIKMYARKKILKSLGIEP